MKRYKAFIYLIIVNLVLSLVFSSCQSQTRIDLPHGFAKYEDESSAFEAVTADAVRLKVHTVRNEPAGSLNVLTNTSQIHFKQIGYKILRDEKITSTSGLTGRLFITSVQTMNGEFRYLAAFFPDEKRIHIVEAAGSKSTFGFYEKDILSKVKTIQPGFFLPGWE